MGVLMWLVSYIESGHLAALDDTLPPETILSRIGRLKTQSLTGRESFCSIRGFWTCFALCTHLYH